MILWLLACAPSGPWTRDAALSPALARVDTDHDGSISAAEYGRVATDAASFAKADADGDGGIDLDELEALLRAEDPSQAVFGGGGQGTPGKGAPGQGPPGQGPPANGAPGKGPPGNGPQGPPPQGSSEGSAFASKEKAGTTRKVRKHGSTWIILTVLRDEVLARDPAAAVPTDEAIVAADHDGFESEAGRSAVATLRTESARLGLGFPKSLAALAARATAPPPPPGGRP